MTTRTDPWPPGTPCWVDLISPDRTRSAAFYAALLGWDVSDEQPGSYLTARLDGMPVAGLAAAMPGATGPVAWHVYLATDDVEATGRAAVEAGASVVVAPMTMGAAGGMGMWTDPAGALFAAWQGGDLAGQGVVEVPGAPLWMDLMTSDVAASAAFYQRVFPITSAPASPGDEYLLFTPAGADRPAGGIGPAPAGQEPAWGVCFAVADVETAAARVVELGGRLVEEPFDLPYGRTCVAAGPHGETFALMSRA